MSTLEERHAAERAKVDALCASDPRQGNVLAELLRLDDSLTADGFHPRDPRTFVFRVFMNPHGDVVSAPLVILTSVLRYMERLTGGLLPAISLAADFASSPELKINDEALPPEVQMAIRYMLTETVELPDEWADHAFHGLGVCGEAFAIDANHPQGEAVLRGPEPENHPDVEPVFYTALVTVDSRVWSTLHSPTTRTYTTVGPDEPGDPSAVAPAVLDALTRFLAAMA